MSVLGPRQEAAAEELGEWWEDLWQRGIGSQVVVLKVPPGWGRSSVLGRIAEMVNAEDAPVTVVIPINGRELPDEKDLQAEEIRRQIADERAWRRAAELLDVDQAGGRLELALQVGGLFAPGPGVGAGVLLVDRAMGVLRKTLWGESAASQGAAVARAARAVAEASRQVPVVVLLDDAERLDRDLAVALLENLTFCRDGQMLVVVAAEPSSDLAAVLRAGDRVALAGLVHTLEADTDMSYPARTALAREQCPGLSELVLRRIGQRTRTFGEVFRVTGSERLAEIRPDDDQHGAVAVADAVIDGVLVPGPPSPEAVLVAWAGGVVHSRQAAAALAAVGAEPLAGEVDVVRAGSLVRLDDPSLPRFTAPVTALTSPVRRAMAGAVLEQAAGVVADSVSGLVDRVVAGRAAHQVCQDLGEHHRLRLLRVQRELAGDLEAAGDLAAGARIAAEALAECPSSGPYEQDRQKLEAAVLRLASVQPTGAQDPLVTELTGEAIRGGAALGLEARVWAAVNLLDMPGRDEQALRLIDQVTAELDARVDLGESEVSWRLLLAFRAGKLGHLSAAQPLLAPLLSSHDDAVQGEASRILRAIKDPHADERLQIETLEAELRTAPSDDGLLRLHAALSRAYWRVGDYRHALQHAQQEVPLRQRLQGPEHPSTLDARANLAERAGQAGDAAGARDQFTALLPIFERGLGPEHLHTLAARGNLAAWTGEAGDAAGARDQYAALLPIFERVLGPEDHDTLTARGNLARWTGVTGDAAGARDQAAALLPIEKRVLGPEHLSTLTTRANLAYWTGEAGDAAGARDQFAALLPILERVLGPEHPDTLMPRGNLARWTGEAGDAAGARDQFAALLSIFERVLGAEHPNTLTARHNLASYTGDAGDAAAARDQFAALVPIRERVSGPEHPRTLITRGNLARYTGEAGDAAGARTSSPRCCPSWSGCWAQSTRPP
jgi:hypothetical protein